MRRRTLRTIAHLVLFPGILLLILYLNRPQSKEKTFAWNTIRYKTASAALPEARGICPGLAESSKPALVVSRVASDGDTKWLDKLTKLYHLCIYTADAPIDKTSNYLQVPANRGHEAMGYLTFLIDNYEHIPEAGAVFVHGSRWAWHNDAPDYDNLALLASLNVSAAVAPWGYHNMRCDWSVSTCSPSSAPPQGSLETSMQATMEPWNARAVSDAALPGALAALFGGDDYDSAAGEARLFLGRTDAIRSQCCAQFAVARRGVWRHSRNEYVALRQWLLDGSSGSGGNKRSQNAKAAPPDDRVAGRILSYLWHILFVQEEDSSIPKSSPLASSGVDLDRLNNIACPSAGDCYCRLYGRCNLNGCTSDQCRGQYHLPPNFKLPNDWAATHA